MKTIDDSIFWKEVFPNLTSADSRVCGYKRVVPFKGKDKTMVIGVFKSELNKHLFFMLADPAKKTDAHPLYPGLYHISPGTDVKTLFSDTKDKYQIGAAAWNLVATSAQLGELLKIGAPVDIPEQLTFEFPVSAPEEPKSLDLEVTEGPSKFEAESAKEYNEINPDHYKADGFESIDVVNTFFKGSFSLGNAFKYMVRCGKKPGVPPEKDLKKAIWYLFNELTTHMSKEEIAKYIKEEVITKHANHDEN